MKLAQNQVNLLLNKDFVIKQKMSYKSAIYSNQVHILYTFCKDTVIPFPSVV